MNLIAAVDKNWAIGCNNKLLVHLPGDMKFFRTTTTGNVVVMGRKTLESFPNQAPLKNRVNIVLTRDENYQVEGAIVVHSTQELMDELQQYEDDKIYVIGGESIYRQLEPMCNKAYITKIDGEFQADAYFPNLDEKADWKMTEMGETQTDSSVEYAFATYTK